MDEKETQQLLLRLLEDMAVVKAKLDVIEEIKTDTKGLNTRIEKIEMTNERHEKTIQSLEKRNSIMEEFTRNNMNDSRKQQTGVFISMGLAVFSAILTLIINII